MATAIKSRNTNNGAAIEELVTRQVTAQDRLRDELLATLEELGGQVVSTDGITVRGTEFVIPETMSLEGAENFLHDFRVAQEEVTSFSRTFDFKPWDMAHAVQSAMRKNFGSAGIQKATRTFFGKNPPEQRSIPVGVGKTINVPWGEIELPIFDGSLHLHGTSHPEKGWLGVLTVYAPKRFQPHVEGLFAMVQHELETNSIYRGKAIDGQEMPGFVDLSTVDPSKVIYSEEVEAQLEANIWSLLRHSEQMRKLEVPLKRAVLLSGKYGTGKTLAAFLTAQIAVENEWSFVYCRPGRDSLSDVMATARLYQPAVVFFEDVDTISSTSESDAVTTLLDIFDGINAKGTELLAVMTTNHVERIHKGMVRPGRLDAVIDIQGLDTQGIQRMIEATVSADLLGEMDYDAIGTAMDGYLPAFVKESIDRTLRYAIARAGGPPEGLETADFVLAANGLRSQLELMESASEGTERDRLHEHFAKLVREAVDGTAVIDQDDDEHMYTLRAPQEPAL